MTTVAVAGRTTLTRPMQRFIGFTLLAGGVVFFAGGPMHPSVDPPDVTVKEHLRLMFDEPTWYPSHTVLTIGLAVMAYGLITLVRSGALVNSPARTAARVAALATTIAVPAMLLHLVAAVDADRIASGASTPLTDIQVIVETITVPFFGLSIAALALIGGLTRTLGNKIVAIPGVLGGVGYALAGATFLFTDVFDPLFPAASGIAVWAAAVGVTLLLRNRSQGPAILSA